MQTIFKALDAVSATGPGPTFMLDTPKELRITLQTTTTGDPSEVVVDFEATLDGVNFFQNAIEVHFFAPTTGSMNQGPGTGLILGFRANLKTLSGGTVPTVTVLIAAFDRLTPGL